MTFGIGVSFHARSASIADSLNSNLIIGRCPIVKLNIASQKDEPRSSGTRPVSQVWIGSGERAGRTGDDGADTVGWRLCRTALLRKYDGGKSNEDQQSTFHVSVSISQIFAEKLVIALREILVSHPRDVIAYNAVNWTFLQRLTIPWRDALRMLDEVGE